MFNILTHAKLIYIIFDWEIFLNWIFDNLIKFNWINYFIFELNPIPPGLDTKFYNETQLKPITQPNLTRTIK